MIAYEYTFTRRRVAELGPQVRGPGDIVQAVAGALIGERESEALIVIAFNTKMRPLAIETVYAGNVAGTQVRVAEVFRLAVRVNATCVAVAHNHPSGDPTPSPDDLHLTAELVAAGRLLDIPVVDHVIVAPEGAWISLRDRGIAFDR